MRVPVWVIELFARLPSPYRGTVQLNCADDGVRSVTYQTTALPPEERRIAVK